MANMPPNLIINGRARHSGLVETSLRFKFAFAIALFAPVLAFGATYHDVGGTLFLDKGTEAAAAEEAVASPVPDVSEAVVHERTLHSLMRNRPCIWQKNNTNPVPVFLLIDYDNVHTMDAIHNATKALKLHKNMELYIVDVPVSKLGYKYAALNLAVYNENRVKYGNYVKYITRKWDGSFETCLNAAKHVGMSRENITNSLTKNSAQIAKLIESNKQVVSNVIGGYNTPTFVVGRRVLPGNSSAEAIARAVNEIGASQNVMRRERIG